MTAKLSRRFYETLGDEITNELVDWLNAVDATYRSDLKELNELNFSRFDAKLEAKLAQLGTGLERRIAEAERTTIRWMFGFWAPTVIAIIALFFKS